MFLQLYQDALEFFKQKDYKLYVLLLRAGSPHYLLSTEKRGLFSWLIGGIIGQKISFTRATSARKKLYVKLGKSDFSPDDIKNFTETDWLNIGIEPFQITIINNILKSYYSKTIKFDSLDDLAEWSKIKGIGKWTLDNILIMYSATSLNKLPDIILTTDLVVKSALKSLYNPPKITSAFITQKTNDWFDHTKNQSYVGLVNWYIWRHWRSFQQDIIKLFKET